MAILELTLATAIISEGSGLPKEARSIRAEQGVVKRREFDRRSSVLNRLSLGQALPEFLGALK